MPSPPPSRDLDRFKRFCGLVGLPLERFQGRIAQAVYGPQRECVIVLPRGNGKSRLTATMAVFHLLTHPEPAAYVGASSRDQARVVFEYARQIAQHPALVSRVTVRHLELRVAGGHLRVLASDGPRAHGLTPTLSIADELWAWSGSELLEAMQTSLVKRPDSKLIVISTASASLDSPLARLRKRALAQPHVEHDGPLTDAHGPDIRLLEWSLDAAGNADDLDAVVSVNPASWVTRQALQRQREALPETVFAQFHACVFGRGEGAWLPPGAWAACRGECPIADGDKLWLGIDIGGSRSASAVVGVGEDLTVPICHVFEGDEAVLAVTDTVRDLAGRYSVQEIAFDPWRYRAEALRLEADGIGPMVEFPQSHARMTVASENLHRVIVEKRLTHPGHPDLDRHISNCIAKQTGRGWRLDKSSRSSNIDAAVALAQAVERAEHDEPAPALVGWL